MLPTFTPFVEYVFQRDGLGANNLPEGQTLEQTFTCMASVSTSGCGFEHQLESVRGALLNDTFNKGFLRPDATLAVVFVTNEDDGSVAWESDLYDKKATGQYGYLSSFRSAHYGTMCDDRLLPYADSRGALGRCGPAPNPRGMGPGKLLDVSRYVDFFTQPRDRGGVKADPADVLLMAIAGPDSPVEVVLSNPGTPGGQRYVQCPQLNEASNPPCVPVVQHSCHDLAQPAFFADPAVRLLHVVRAAAHHRIASICETDFSQTLSAFASAIVDQMAQVCVPAFAQSDGTWDRDDCFVQDEVTLPDGTVRVTEIPRCAKGDAALVLPCWRVEQQARCRLVTGTETGITVDRAEPAAEGTATSGWCGPRPS